jgi:CarboxypepD_reg-like domain/TonB-dependent Receptor Plug Domain
MGQVLRGRVIDSDNKAQIPFATVTINGGNLKKVIQSDSLGNFEFNNLQFGRYNLQISSIGYERKELNSLLVTNGKQTVIEVVLTPSVEQLEEIKIKANNLDNNKISTKSLVIEQSERYAATWGDPARMAMSFAGVGIVNDQSNELVIRGNSPKGMLWMIEGVEVSNPNHFASDGASGGSISAITSSILQNSTFLTGAFPAQYGNALSGVFDISLRNGNAEKKEYSVNAGLLGAEVGAEGYFTRKQKDTYLVNYRFANPTLIKSLGLSGVLNAVTPKFQDMAFKFNFIRNKTTFTLWGIAAKNSTNFEIPAFLSAKNKSNFYVGGLRIFRQLSLKTTSETTLSFSENQQSNGNKYVDQSESKVSNLNGGSVRLASTIYYRLNQNNTFQAGTIVSRLSYNLFGSFEFNFPNLGIFVKDTNLSSNGATYNFQNFALVKHRIGKINMNIGVHSNYFLLNNQLLIEPRASISYEINHRKSLTMSIGKHSRLESLSIYLFKNNILLNQKVVENKNLSPTKAIHFVLGYNERLKSNWNLNSEVYFQHLYSVPVGDTSIMSGVHYLSLLNQLNSVNLNPLVNNGFGRNYGWEVTIEKTLHKGFYGLFTSSIFRSLYKNASDANYLSTRFDNRFVLNMLAGKEWVLGKNLINFNLRTTWAGGIRQLSTELINGNPNTISDQGYENKLGNYLRLDTKVSYIFSIKQTTSSLSIDINNLTDRANPLTKIFNPLTQKYEIINQLGILPVLSYKFNF